MDGGKDKSKMGFLILKFGPSLKGGITGSNKGINVFAESNADLSGQERSLCKVESLLLTDKAIMLYLLLDFIRELMFGKW